MAHFPFQRLQSELAELIAKMPAGSRLPSEPDLARQMGVSRATLREAMRTFETQGLIRRRQGAGTFVVGQVHVIDAGLELLESLETMAKRLGLAVSMGDFRITEISADKELAEALSTEVGKELVRVQRVMWAEDRPVAYLVDILPENVLHPDELVEGFRGSVLDFLLNRGDPLSVSRTAVTATGASAEVAKALQIQRGDVLLQFVAQLYSATGRVISFSTSYFIPGYFNFHVVRRVANH